MKTTSQDRQRKWKAKQEAEGKKAITVMLDARVKDLIDNERKRTGETIAGVLERAVSNLLFPVSDNSDQKSEGVTSNKLVDLIRKHPQAAKIFEVVGLFHNSGGKIKDIIYALNSGKYKTFYDNDEWAVSDVKEIMAIVEHNRPLYWKIRYGDQ